ncbi:MAG TPA: threonine/serine exporter family protein [Opitutales bacterium]|nr:threonine/serine exporter family protein [Opitutales bacterium]
MCTSSLLAQAAFDFFFSGMAALAFAFLFNLEKSHLLPCALCAGVGHVTQFLALQSGLTFGLASLLGATWIGFLGYIIAGKLNVARVVFTVPAIIPMFPGTFAFKALMGVVYISGLGQAASSDLILETVVNFTRTAVILCALAAGIAAPTLLLPWYRPKD